MLFTNVYEKKPMLLLSLFLSLSPPQCTDSISFGGGYFIIYCFISFLNEISSFYLIGKFGIIL